MAKTVAHVVGARPNFMKAAPVIRALETRRIAQTVMNLQGVTNYVRKPTGAMPAYTEKILSDKELTDIFAYLKSLPPAKAVKDIPLLDQIK